MFDHPRAHMENWTSVIYTDPEASKYLWGLAFHWYSSCHDADQFSLAWCWLGMRVITLTFWIVFMRRIQQNILFNLKHAAVRSKLITGNWGNSTDTIYLVIILLASVPSHSFFVMCAGDLNHSVEGWTGGPLLSHWLHCGWFPWLCLLNMFLCNL